VQAARHKRHGQLALGCEGQLAQLHCPPPGPTGRRDRQHTTSVAEGQQGLCKKRHPLKKIIVVLLLSWQDEWLCHFGVLLCRRSGSTAFRDQRARAATTRFKSKQQRKQPAERADERLGFACCCNSLSCLNRATARNPVGHHASVRVAAALRDVCLGSLGCYVRACQVCRPPVLPPCIRAHTLCS
jgi:hypothetical protein